MSSLRTDLDKQLFEQPFSLKTYSKFNFIDMIDQEQESCQSEAIFICQETNPNSLAFNKIQTQQKDSKQALIKQFKFREFFSDFKDRLHNFFYFGSDENQQHQSQQWIEKKLIEKLVSILFKISQEQKSLHPHLLIHIKEQFHKPNIVEQLNLKEDLKLKYSQLVTLFFGTPVETSTFEEFVQQNPEFVVICVQVFEKISYQYKKFLYSNRSNGFQSKSFQAIQSFCIKFSIETSYFSLDSPSVQMLALGSQAKFVFFNQQNAFFFFELQKFQFPALIKIIKNNSFIDNKKLANQSQTDQDQKEQKNHQQTDQSQIEQWGSYKENIFSQLERVDSEDTSNYDQSIIKGQFRLNQFVSEQNTPKFKTTDSFQNQISSDSFHQIILKTGLIQELHDQPVYSQKDQNDPHQNSTNKKQQQTKNQEIKVLKQKSDISQLLNRNNHRSQTNLIIKKDQDLSKSQIVDSVGQGHERHRSQQKKYDISLTKSFDQKLKRMTERSYQKVQNLKASQKTSMAFPQNNRQEIKDQSQLSQINTTSEYQSRSSFYNQSVIMQQKNQSNKQSNNQDNPFSQNMIKYSFRTKKNERQQYRFKKRQKQYSPYKKRPSKNRASNNELVLNQYPYPNLQLNTDQNDLLKTKNQTSQIDLKNKGSPKSNDRQSNLQKNHSSYIPVYQAVDIKQQQKLRIPQSFQINFVNTNQNLIKIFQQSFLGVSQVLNDSQLQIFNIQTKNNCIQSSSIRPRKVTDTYESPLTDFKMEENRTSQLIQNNHPIESQLNKTLKLNDNLSHDRQKSDLEKNYLILSNITYDQVQKQQNFPQKSARIEKNTQNFNQEGKERGKTNLKKNLHEKLDFEDFQRLIFEKKRQRNKMSSHQVNIFIPKNKTGDEPENWIRKQIFYFFDVNSVDPKSPIKRVILKSPRTPSNHQSSQTSINNCKQLKVYIPESQFQKDIRPSNMKLRKSTSQNSDLRTVSSINFRSPFQDSFKINLSNVNHQNHHSPDNYHNSDSTRFFKKSPDHIGIQTKLINQQKQAENPNIFLKLYSSQKLSHGNQRINPQSSQRKVKFTWGHSPNSYADFTNKL